MTSYMGLTMLCGPTLPTRCVTVRTIRTIRTVRTIQPVAIRSVGAFARCCVAGRCESGSALWRAVGVATRT